MASHIGNRSTSWATSAILMSFKMKQLLSPFLPSTTHGQQREASNSRMILRSRGRMRITAPTMIRTQMIVVMMMEIPIILHLEPMLLQPHPLLNQPLLHQPIHRLLHQHLLTRLNDTTCVLNVLEERLLAMATIRNWRL